MEQDTAVLAVASPEGVEPVVPEAPRRSTGWLKSVGIVATGLVAGAIGVATIQGSHGTTTASAQGGPVGQRFGGPGGQGFGGPGGPGGFGRPRGGGMPVMGTISAISPSSITVGSTTASITSATVVIKDGAASTVSALAGGDQVVVLTTTSGTSTVARGILAGSSAQGGPRGGFGGPPRQPLQGQQPAQPGSGSSST